MKRNHHPFWLESLFSMFTARKQTLFLTILLLVTLVFSGIGVFIHRGVQRLLIEELGHSAVNTAMTAASFIEADLKPYEALTKVKSYEEGAFDSLYYAKMQRTFQDIRKKTSASFVYTMKKVSEEEVMYLLDGEDPASALFSPVGTIEKMDEHQRSVLLGKGAAGTDLLYWEGWGEFITGNAPIRDQKGNVLGLVGVDIGTGTVTALMEGVDMLILLVALFLILLLTLYTYKIVADLSTAYNEDYLTKLSTRRHHDRQLEVEIRKVRRKGGTLSVMMIDVDNFKTINDGHGHEAGDAMLRHVAEVIRGNLRRTDISSRIGGDEFNIIQPGASLSEAKKVASAIISELEAGQGQIKVSVSIGAAAWDETMDASMLKRAADEAMYKAKASGRNQVQTFQE